MFKIKSQLPIETQVEIDRIQAISEDQRLPEEVDFLTSLAPYLTNIVYEYDPNGDILRCAGETVPVGEAGFARGCLFTLIGSSLDTGSAVPITSLFENVVSNTYCNFDPVKCGFSGNEITPIEPVAGTVTLTSDNTKPANGAIIYTHNVTTHEDAIYYTFKTSLSEPAVANEILIDTDADTTLGNLKAAINGEAGEGTKYSAGTVANPDVTCGEVISHAVILTNKIKGSRSVVEIQTAKYPGVLHLTFSNTYTAGGVSGTTARAGTIIYDSDNLYISVGNSTVSTSNWKKIALSAL